MKSVINCIYILANLGLFLFANRLMFKIDDAEKTDHIWKVTSLFFLAEIATKMVTL